MDQVPDIERPLRWGLWSLDAGSYVLNHDGDAGYWVDLERCRSSAEVLDRIVQVSHKAWADSYDVAMLWVSTCCSGAGRWIRRRLSREGI